MRLQVEYVFCLYPHFDLLDSNKLKISKILNIYFYLNVGVNQSRVRTNLLIDKFDTRHGTSKESSSIKNMASPKLPETNIKVTEKKVKWK